MTPLFRTLLVESDGDLRNALKSKLPHLNARLAIEAVGTKEAALSALPAGFDFLVADSQLPGDRLGFLAVIDAARAYATKPRIVVTGERFDSMTMTRVQECGAKILIKVFDADELLRLLFLGIYDDRDAVVYSDDQIVAALLRRRDALKRHDAIGRRLVDLGLAGDGTVADKARWLGCARQRLEYDRDKTGSARRRGSQ